jgi:penicillin-binding protein 2
MNARRAIAMSSNIYFYTVAGGNNTFDGMGIDNLVNYLQMFGLGEATNVDLPNETQGRVPTPEWKRAQHGEVWHTGDTYNLAIGQGSLLVSPLQMLRAHSAIANGGNLMRPFLAQKAGPKVAAKPDITGRDYRVVREGMRMVTSGSGTTPPSTFADVGPSVAGKSGTAETNPGVRDSHAWYSAFAPFENPQLQGVVILEDGEGGSKYAAPALADAFAWYFQGHDSHD